MRVKGCLDGGGSSNGKVSIRVDGHDGGAKGCLEGVWVGGDGRGCIRNKGFRRV